MKKVLSLVLVLTLVLGSFSFAFANEAQPTDNEKVNALIDLGLVVGDAGGYRLNDTITRAEAAVMVVNALDLGSVAQASKYASSFSDVSANHWALGYVNVAAGRGIVAGYPDGTFRPDANISYAEIITMMVQILGGLNEQEAKAPWPANMITKASELGVLEDVEIANFAEVAVREKVFEVVYNTRFSEKTGVYQIVKAIVLENYRVESIKDNNVVVEVIREIQKGNFTEQSRKEQGDQFRVEIPVKLGDVENLLGKVVDLSFDKNGKVVKVVVDDSYEYLVGEITETTGKTITLDYTDKYTVKLDERYKEDDERVFRTYFNNEAMKYVDFDEDEGAAGYARVTVKNGKVLFIDAYDFDDVAPVVDVTNSLITILDDVSDASEKDIKKSNIDYVVDITKGEFKKSDLDSIEDLDVIHYYGDTIFVRKDAVVEGEYDKIRSNRVDSKTNKVSIYLENGDQYGLNFENSYKAVYSTNGEDFEVLTSNRPDRQLESFRGEEVILLLDMNDNVQYISAEVEDLSFDAIIKDVLGRDIKFVKDNGETSVYETTFDTYYGTIESSRETKLKDFQPHDLVAANIDTDGKVTELYKVTDFAKKNAEVARINKDIVIVGGTTYEIEKNTNIFVDNGSIIDGMTIAELIKDYKTVVSATNPAAPEGVKASVVLNKAGELQTIIFTAIEAKAAYTWDTVRVKAIDSYTTTTYEVVVTDADGEEVVYKVKRPSAAYSKIDSIKEGDIIDIKLTSGDNAVLVDFDVVIEAGKAVYKLAKIDGRDLYFEDKDGDKLPVQTLSRDAVQFDRLSVGKKFEFAVNDDNYIVVIAEAKYPNNALTKYVAPVDADQEAADEVVALINELPAEVTLANKDAVVAAREAYDALTDAQKALVAATVLEKLQAAEAKIAELEKPEEEFTATLGNFNPLMGYVDVTVTDSSKVSSIKVNETEVEATKWRAQNETVIRIIGLDQAPTSVELVLESGQSVEAK